VGESWRNLERDESVGVLVIDLAQHIGGVLDVGDRQALVERNGVEALVRQLRQRVVVVVGAEDRPARRSPGWR